MQIFWEEHEHAWSGSHPVEDVVTQFEHNPYGPFQKFDIRTSFYWRPYAHAKVVSRLLRGKSPLLSFRGKDASASTVRGSIWRSPGQNWLSFEMDDANLRADGQNSALLAFIQRVARALPRFSWAHANGTNDDRSGFLSDPQLPALPLCFNLHARWYHLLSPLAYEAAFTREDLLAAPAHSVRELDNGWIEIISYPDPLAYDRPESQQRIIELTRYLDERRGDLWDRPQRGGQ